MFLLRNKFQFQYPTTLYYITPGGGFPPENWAREQGAPALILCAPAATFGAQEKIVV